MKCLIVFVAVCAVLYADAKPAQFQLREVDDFGSPEGSDNDNFQCHGVTCPTGTVACSKTTKTSSDRKTLLMTVRCEDFNGNILNSETRSSENPYENTQISSFSFTGHYNYNGGTQVRKPVGTLENNYYNNNEVETFQ